MVIFAPLLFGLVLLAASGLALTAYPVAAAAIMPGMTDVDLRVLSNTAIVGACAVGLTWILVTRAQERRRLRRVTDMDPVTALSNQRSFVSQAQSVLSQSGVLLLLDIDHFREINDRGGRRVGDLCLMALAQRFRELIRSTDIVGRFDGATFAIYLPGTTLEQAHTIADRLSRGVIVVNEEVATRATASVGLVFANGRTALDHLLRNAGGALERAKLQGRACVVSDEAPLAA